MLRLGVLWSKRIAAAARIPRVMSSYAIQSLSFRELMHQLVYRPLSQLVERERERREKLNMRESEKSRYAMTRWCSRYDSWRPRWSDCRTGSRHFEQWYPIAPNLRTMEEGIHDLKGIMVTHLSPRGNHAHFFVIRTPTSCNFSLPRSGVEDNADYHCLRYAQLVFMALFNIITQKHQWQDGETNKIVCPGGEVFFSLLNRHPFFPFMVTWLSISLFLYYEIILYYEAFYVIANKAFIV